MMMESLLTFISLKAFVSQFLSSSVEAIRKVSEEQLENFNAN
jgi:hypothetical protein